MMEVDELPTNFDEVLGAFLGAKETERDALWRQGDVIAREVAQIHRAAGEEPSKLMRRRVNRALRTLYGLVASGANCTTAYVRQLGQVAATFGTEQRYPDKPWALFRAVRNAAIRNKLDARELLDDAIAKAWGVSELNALGREVPIELAASGECDECGASVRVKIVGQAAARAEVNALSVGCPVCVALAWARGTDGREASLVGSLQ